MKEARRGECQKCKKTFYVDRQHILPKSEFGSKGDTIDLCPNCYRWIHEEMKKNIKDSTDKNEVIMFFRNWLAKATFVLFVGFMLYVFFR